MFFAIPALWKFNGVDSLPSEFKVSHSSEALSRINDRYNIRS